MADSLVVDLAASYSEGQGERGTLDYLRIVNDPEQIARQYRRMLSDVRQRVPGVFASALRGGSAGRTTGEAGADRVA